MQWMDDNDARDKIRWHGLQYTDIINDKLRMATQCGNVLFECGGKGYSVTTQCILTLHHVVYFDYQCTQS